MRGQAYSWYAAVTKNAAQRRYWNAYKVVNIELIMRIDLSYGCSSNYSGNREGILDLHKSSHGSVPIRRYDSQYMGNPYGEPLLGLCHHENKVVGQENYIMHDVGCGGSIFKGALGVDSLIHAKYRLFYGIFGKLCQLTIDEMKKKVDILCAFANEESKKYYLKYFKWKVASKIQVYKKAVRFAGVSLESLISLVRSGKIHQDLKLEKVTQFEPVSLNPVIEQNLKTSDRLYFYKTADFLNWKFLNNKHYDVIGYHILYDGNIIGFCTTYNDGIEKKILDIQLKKKDVKWFEKTISTLAYLSRKEGLRRLVIYATPGCWYEKALKRHFFIRRWDFDFITREFTPLPDTGWIVNIGDLDVF